MASIFVDNHANRYSDPSGDFIAVGAETADVNTAFGYKHSIDVESQIIFARIGPAPDYAQPGNIGQADVLGFGDDDTSGYHGEHDLVAPLTQTQTTLLQGVGTSSGLLAGIEVLNINAELGPVRAAANPNNWRLAFRDPNDPVAPEFYANALAYVVAWLAAHPARYPDRLVNPQTYTMHLSNDPEDDSFWMNMVIGSPNAAGDRAPIFNIDPADGSLIRTVELAVPTANLDTFLRAERIVVEDEPPPPEEEGEADVPSVDIGGSRDEVFVQTLVTGGVEYVVEGSEDDENFFALSPVLTAATIWQLNRRLPYVRVRKTSETGIVRPLWGPQEGRVDAREDGIVSPRIRYSDDRKVH